ncbi:MAG: DUF6516 family protein [Halosimplex sp.]
MGEDEATLLVRERENFDERYAEVEARSVPESDRYPEGVKYSFQYGEFDGDTVVRYDNFPDHPDAPDHHRHDEDGTIEGIEFEGVAPLYERFKSEVTDHGHDWD